MVAALIQVKMGKHLRKNHHDYMVSIRSNRLDGLKQETSLKSESDGLKQVDDLSLNSDLILARHKSVQQTGETAIS